jgi:superfamily II DNA or RNA helicase
VIIIDGRIRIPLSELSEDDATQIRNAHTYANPNYGKNQYGTEQPQYRTWEHDQAGNLTVPRGGLRKVREILGGLRPEPGFRSVDKTTWSHPEPSFPEHLRSLRDYQEELIAAALGDPSGSGLWRAPVGCGKTTAGYGLLARLKRRALVMVWSSALLKQWKERAVEELGLKPSEVGHIQGDRESIRPLTLAMQQTMVQRFARGDTSLAREFDILICDEVQRFAASTLFAAVDPIEARVRLGISADESRRDGLEPLIYDLFGPVMASVDEPRIIASGAVVEVEINVVPTTFEAPWYRYRQDFNKLLYQMCTDEKRNAIILGLVRSAVTSGEQVIVFTHRVEHARYLDAEIARMGIPGGLMLGGQGEALEFDRTKMRLKAGQLRAAVGTYQAIAQGIDVPGVARGICATPIGNNRQQLGQVRGRICRAAAGKTMGRLGYLADTAIYGRKPIENFTAWHRVVKVWSGRAWIDGPEYLASLRRRRAS